ncbi:unnamed protein product [Echinostoma caproni]|uniref:Uncharacterized protein n=1 Tax=Echinostoma caproni TaxID=27848 RepID=A0A183BE10_9TREM|nr:unnamed protein product [Echinostoma caproni]
MVPVPATPGVSSVQPLRTNTMEPRDVELLFTATQFTDEVEYLAVPDSICTPRALAVIQIEIRFDLCVVCFSPSSYNTCSFEEDT